MSENLPEFLNENPGVVGAIAGTAINQNIAATNRNISALQGELGKLQEQFAREQSRDKQERLNRDKLFQVYQQVEAINSVPASPEMYIALFQVSENFQRLGFTSRTFSSLQDKAFFSNVSSLVDQSFTTMWESFSVELREQIADLLDWNCLKDLADIIAIADAKMPSIKTKLSNAKKEREAIRKKKKPNFFSNIFQTVLMFGLPFLFAKSLFSLEAVLDFFGSQTFMVGVFETFLMFCAIAPWVVRIFTLDAEEEKHSSDERKNKVAVKLLIEELWFLESNRATFARRLSKLQRVPVDTINFLTSERVEPKERFALVDQISTYVADLCSSLGLDKSRLPTAPERQESPRHLRSLLTRREGG
jgi:hypothetical protein